MNNQQPNQMRSSFTARPMQSQMNPNIQNSMHVQMQMSNMNNQMQPNRHNQMTNAMPMMNSQMNSNIQNQMAAPLPMSNINNQMNANIKNQMSNVNTQMNPNIQNQMSNINNQMSYGNQTTQQYNMRPNQMVPQQQPSLQIQMQQRPNDFPVALPQQQIPQPPPVVQQAAQPVAQQQSKEINTATLCKVGQETVHDIIGRSQEVFQTLKTILPPNGTPQSKQQSDEKKAKVQELLKNINLLFKRLKLVCEKFNENCQLQGMEYTHIESLIPFKDDFEPKYDEKKNSEAYKVVCEERAQLKEQVELKNKQIKDVVDQMRKLTWEVNTMLAMRKS